MRSVSPTSAAGVSRDFKVVGLFDTGVTAEDDGLAYVTLKTAQTLAEAQGAVNGIRVKLDDPYAADAVARRIEAVTGLDARSWQEANQSFLEAIVVRNAVRDRRVVRQGAGGVVGMESSSSSGCRVHTARGMRSPGRC